MAAFRQIGHVLRRVGLFATRAAHFVCIYLTLIFGSGASPGNFEILGDALIQTLLLQPREDFEINGKLHPEIARWVDDFLSFTAMFGNRCSDHCDRVRRLITALFGPGGLNLEKEMEVGQPSSYKHAFGIVVDTVQRLASTPWSKIVKLFLLVKEFMEDPQAVLDYELLCKVHGGARNCTICANGMERILLPRLEAGLASAFAQNPGEAKNIPKRTVPSFALMSETPEEGKQMLRRAFNTFFRLGSLDRGKLYRKTPEMLLPTHERQTWPGREGPEDKVRAVMDASGKHMFVIDMKSLKRIRRSLTDSELQLFNAFEQGEGATNINLYELLTELFYGVEIAPEHAGKLISMGNDNTAAEHRTNRNHHRHARVDFILSVLGLVELLYRITFIGERISTENNFADTGTRDTRSEDYLQGLAVEKGLKSEALELPPWMYDISFDSLTRFTPEGEWFEFAIKCLERIEGKHPGLSESHCGVAMDRVLRELRAASKLEPLDAEIFVADGDFLDVPRCSPERLALTGVVLPTQTMLRRKLIRLKAQKGRQAGVELFNTQLNQPRDADPEVSIDLEMEKQKVDYFKVLYQKDLEFTNHTTDPPQPLLEPVGWIPPSGHRMMEQPTLGSGYSGLNPLAEAARVAGLGVTKFDAESHPRLRKHLENLNPEALHFADVAQLMGPDTPGTV